MNFSENVDEIVAMIMAVAGVVVLMGGLYGICMSLCDLEIEELLLVSTALIGPATGYLFGKSVPKQENTIKDMILKMGAKQK